jgi:hypothetical protein
VARITVGLGLACALALWGLWGSVLPSAGLVLAVCVLALLVERSPGASVQIGLECGLAVMGCAGLLAAFGWAAAMVLFLVAATSPGARTLLRSRRLAAVRRRADISARAPHEDGLRSMDRPAGSARDAAGGPLRLVALADMPSADGLHALDDGALCQAWRRSYVRLEASRAADVRLEVVRLRQVYLDELVRRHPAEVRQWLKSGARAAGNPLPFIRRPECQGGAPEDGGREDSRGG